MINFDNQKFNKLTEIMSKQVQNYILQEVLGEGSYGSVYKGQNLNTKVIVAIKQMSVNKFQKVPKLYEFIQNEIDVLQKIKNQNIIKLHEVFRTPNNIYLVYEFCEGGTLESKLKKKVRLNETEALLILLQLANALKSLKENKILHRDLKPGNILIQNEDIKLADFGFCKSLSHHQDLTKTVLGSPIYMAPEVLKGQNYNAKADIWSLGITFFEMLFGKYPYNDKSIYGLITQIDTKPLIIPVEEINLTLESNHILKQMLHKNDKERIDIFTLHDLILNHPMIRSNHTYQSPQKPLQNITNQNTPQPSHFNLYYRRNTEKAPNKYKGQSIHQKSNFLKNQDLHYNIYQERNKLFYLNQTMMNAMNLDFMQPLLPGLCKLLFQQSQSLEEKVLNLFRF